jgi:hypothetical protein
MRARCSGNSPNDNILHNVRLQIPKWEMLDLTSIKLTVTGAKARAKVAGLLTSGMVGIPVSIEYDDSWEGTTKNLVCMCREGVRDPGVTRAILNVGNSAVVAHEVMLSGRELYLGIEGRSADGKLVEPTTWAYCGKIEPGANVDADLSANPKLSVWGQLQTEINQLKAQTITEDQVAACVATYLEENPIELPETPQSSALNAAQINALDGMFKVCAFTKADVSAEYAAFQAAFGISGGEEEPDEPVNPEVTLTSISATYSGGDVAVGTAVTDLTGIVVTAHYSDGTSKAVTGYTLSGTIAEGGNTVTVTYQGKTATFTVTGVAESGGDEPEVTTEVLSNFQWRGSGWPTGTDNGDGSCTMDWTSGGKTMYDEVPGDSPSAYWTCISPGKISGGQLAVKFNKPVTMESLGICVYAVNADATLAYKATDGNWIWNADMNSAGARRVSADATLDIPDGLYPYIIVRSNGLKMEGDTDTSNIIVANHIVNGDIVFEVTG